jgi:hypothetical protein
MYPQVRALLRGHADLPLVRIARFRSGDVRFWEPDGSRFWARASGEHPGARLSAARTRASHPRRAAGHGRTGLPGKGEVASLGQGLQTASRVAVTSCRRRAGRSRRRRPSGGNARPALGAKELVCPPPHYGTSSPAHVHLLLSAVRRCAASTRGGRCATGLCALI